MRVGSVVLIQQFLAAAIVLIASAGAGSAAPTVVDCSSDFFALRTIFQTTAVIPGTTFALTAKCFGDLPISNIPAPGVTIEQEDSSGEIDGSLIITSSIVNLNTITLNSAAGTDHGIHVMGGFPGSSGAMPSAVSLVNVTIENSPASGVWLGEGGSLIISDSLITGSTECGIFLGNGASAQISGTAITSSGKNAALTEPGDQSGIHVENGATLMLANATVNNGTGPALWISQATVTDSGSHLDAALGVTVPIVVVRRGSLDVSGDVIDGTGHSNAIFANPGATITMQGTSVQQSDATDATVLIASSSTLLSLGGNHITNSGANGIAISVVNDSTLREFDETSFKIPLTADSFTGGGLVQVQSNMELGTGATVPSMWTGAITVQQNSSFRMDGGMSISGGVTLLQGSNGFFNKSAGGTNSTAVTCAGTGTSHVAGGTLVSPPVTLVTTLVGCYAF